MKTVKKPMILAGASNYLAWSKALKVACQVDTEKIILERQETSLQPENLKISQYWNVQDKWLHSLINSTISAQAREHFKELDSLSAYKLWKAVRTAFQERSEHSQALVNYSSNQQSRLGNVIHKRQSSTALQENTESQKRINWTQEPSQKADHAYLGIFDSSLLCVQWQWQQQWEQEKKKERVLKNTRQQKCFLKEEYYY
ncbi:hypothetical protein CIRG_06370 [Coccidioides immitis RMSCC 2394]|uniref:Uncharacterized protein n=1 Tax=Coccidioides immitis RMSCC 2394 TaxID=404692 RepID=A0A0J6YHY1_COCIT|nr:hypothetical protein CIRG_06370 [Coccidioides immitis RMSCC 2394]